MKGLRGQHLSIPSVHVHVAVPGGSVSVYSPSISNKGMKVKELPQGIAQELALVGDSLSPSYGGHSISQSGTVSSWLKRAVSLSIVCYVHVSSSFACCLGSGGLCLGHTAPCASFERGGHAHTQT